MVQSSYTATARVYDGRVMAKARCRWHAVAAEGVQVWKLTANDGHTAALLCEDGNGRGMFSEHIECTGGSARHRPAARFLLRGFSALLSRIEEG
jgi:L-asparaginase II